MELVIAMAMSGIIALVFSSLLQDVFRSQNTQEVQAEVTDLELGLIRAMSYNSFCRCNFGGAISEIPAITFDIDAPPGSIQINPYNGTTSRVISSYDNGNGCRFVEALAGIGYPLSLNTRNITVSDIVLTNIRKINSEKVYADLRVSFTTPAGRAPVPPLVIPKLLMNMTAASGANEKVKDCVVNSSSKYFNYTSAIAYDSVSVGGQTMTVPFGPYTHTSGNITLTMTPTIPNIVITQNSELVVKIQGVTNWTNLTSESCNVGYYSTIRKIINMTLGISRDGSTASACTGEIVQSQNEVLVGGGSFALPMRTQLVPGDQVRFCVQASIAQDPALTVDCVDNFKVQGVIDVAIRPL